MKTPSTSILFYNVTVFDGEKTLPNQSVLTEDRYIKDIQPVSLLPVESKNGIEIVDGSGLFLCPGFIDSHLHILSYAASMIGADLSDVKGHGASVFGSSLYREAGNMGSDEWLRCYSLDYFDDSLASALNKEFLDQVVPDVPTVIRFDSGHGCLLNSVALRKIGLTNESEEPDGVTFERNLKDGSLNGVLFEADNFLESRIPRIKESEIKRGLSLANTSFLEKGITTVVDASENNDNERLQIIHDAIDRRILNTGIVFMPGYRNLSEFLRLCDFQALVNSELVIGPVKIMLSMSSGEMRPTYDNLKRMVSECHDQGFPVAIHAVERQCVSHAIDVLGDQLLPGNRIEHASELSDEDLNRLGRYSIGVSTQPSLVYVNGDRYIKQNPDGELFNLYRLRSMMDAGVLVGISSDAPVTRPDPFLALYSACNRKTVNGEYLNPSETVSPTDFLRSITYTNARLVGFGDTKGKIGKGFQADLVLLNEDPTLVETEDLMDISVEMTVIKGNKVYER